MQTQFFASMLAPLGSPQLTPIPCNPAPRPIRFGVIGLGSSQDSISGQLAHHLTELGAELAAIADLRRDVLADVRPRFHGSTHEVNAYTDFDAMLRREALDAVVVCSPTATLRQQLQTALAHGVHVLCEKPLLWEVGRDLLTDVRPLVTGFAEAGKVLLHNEPWPYTLPCFDELYPAARIYSLPPQQLAVLLCTAEAGLDMIVSAVPHALSLLFALCPACGVVERLRVEPNDARDGITTALTISFQYIHSSGRASVSIDLCQMQQTPRPAGYSIDGRSVRRVVRMPGHQWFFVAQDSSHSARPSEFAVVRPQRRVPIDDPLRLLLSDFLRRVQLAEQGTEMERQGEPFLERLGLLRSIHSAARTVLDTGEQGRRSCT